MSNYKVSVITAFHNTSQDLFEKTNKSMQTQTIGFKNVQWVIVLHNCEKEYIDRVTDMYKNDSNVKIVVLNNDKHTPGSPRNEAFKYVESKYVLSLDSDDTFSPDCLEKIVHEMDETDADILRFRTEVILLKENILHANILSSVNATYERRIYEKGDWNVEEIFGGYFGCSFGQIYKIDFIRKHNLLFHEDQPLAEDILFNTRAFGLADRICLLPQYIGYQYYQVPNSICRSSESTDEEIIEMAYGFDRIFKELMNFGVDYTFFCYGAVALVMCGKIIESPKITREGRLKVKEILGPYVLNTSLIQEDKYYDRNTIITLYNTLRAVILFPERPIELILRNKLDGIFTLMSIMKNNANTDYGKRYNFSKFKSETAYVNQVPLCDAKMVKPLFDLMYRVGDKNIVIEGKADGYIKNEDETLTYPITKKFILDLVKTLDSELSGHNNFLVAKSSKKNLKSADEVNIHKLESLLINSYSAYKFAFESDKTNNFINGPSALYRYFGDENVYENLIIDALSFTKMDQIVGLNAKQLLEVFNLLENNYAKYINESKCDDERKKELIKICESGFDGIAKKIWPKLERVIAFGCGKYKDSYEKLQKYVKGLKYNHGSYITEMGILGVATGDDSDIFEVHSDKYFIELLKENNETDDTILLTYSSTNKTYELIMTNENGLYRYKTNVFIKPVEVSETTFKFKFV